MKPESPWRAVLRQTLAAARRLVILGVGNDQRGDDAAGLLCLRSLRKTIKNPGRLGLLLLEGGAAPENFTGTVRRFRPTHVLIIDAGIGGGKPGAIFFVDPARIAGEDLTTHRLPLSHLARYLEQDIGCRVLCLGIEPRSLREGGPPSPSVTAAASSLAEAIVSSLSEKRSARAVRSSRSRT